jgi:hypothetical protein
VALVPAVPLVALVPVSPGLVLPLGFVVFFSGTQPAISELIAMIATAPVAPIRR